MARKNGWEVFDTFTEDKKNSLYLVVGLFLTGEVEAANSELDNLLWGLNTEQTDLVNFIIANFADTVVDC